MRDFYRHEIFRVGWGVSLSICLMCCERPYVQKYRKGIRGTGAAGYISVTNNTQDVLEVSWGGFGCFGISDRFHTLICDTEYISPGDKFTYGYNWGVTETWIWFAIPSQTVFTDIQVDVWTDAKKTSYCSITQFDSEHVDCENPKKTSLINSK